MPTIAHLTRRRILVTGAASLLPSGLLVARAARPRRTR